MLFGPHFNKSLFNKKSFIQASPFINFFVLLYILSFLPGCHPDDAITPEQKIVYSDGNVWSPTTVLPDTGNTVYIVSLQDMIIGKNDEIFLATNFGGVFLSTDNGVSWTTQNNGLIKDTGIPGLYTTTALGCIDEYIFVGSWNEDSTGIYLYHNSGNYWTPQIVWSDKYISSFASTSDKIIAGTNFGLYSSSDYGNSWNDIGQNLNWYYIGYANCILPMESGRIFIGTFHGVYKTENWGSTWTLIGFADSTGQVVTLASDTSGNLFAANYGKLFVQKKNQDTWKEIFSVQDNGGVIHHILILPNNTIFLSTTWGIYRSKDGGINWDFVFPHQTVVKVAVNSQGHLVASTWMHEVFISVE